MGSDPIFPDQFPLIRYFHGRAKALIFETRYQTTESGLTTETLNPGPPPEAVTLGRISLLREYGGKVRCFAIPSAITQFALFPIHKELFKVLNALESDFTFDQGKFRLLMQAGKWGYHTPAWCYDLKSATDLFPIQFQIQLLNRLFENCTSASEGRVNNLGVLWSKVIQKGPYKYKSGSGRLFLINYEGQPMGAYSS